MTPLDLFLLIPITFSLIRGFRKGLIIEVFSFIALVLALIAGIKLTSTAMHWLEGSLHGAVYLPFISYSLVFIGVFVIVTLIGNAFDKAADLVQLGPINKIAGSVFCLFKIIFMMSLFFWLGDRINLLSDGMRDHSFFYSHFHKFAPYVINKASSSLPFMKNALSGVEGFFNEIKE